MLWIAFAFIVAMMIGFLIPRKPLKLDLSPRTPPAAPSPKDPFGPPSQSASQSSGDV